MALFKWSPSLEIGIPEIDAEHRRLFSLADELHVALAQAASASAIQERLASLIDHSRAHFAHEEEFMGRCQYPERAAHKAEHDRLTARALQMQREFIANGRELTSEILRSLHGWLATHVETADRQVSEYFLCKCECCPRETGAKY